MACPICSKDTDPKYRPFCSKRCADIDLGRWLTGSYVIPGDLHEEEEDSSRSDADGGPLPH
ncbi:DNA gyrase inhibitor YacG [Phaeovulum sp. W22_SRMD_FR3]|uniref:DNA gyrase inhibitor YacG n=1 Tax=Phaeovulum sp. W22_SRMD_FR3 TaxID=3240274 RepID=UPI003F9AFC7B